MRSIDRGEIIQEKCGIVGIIDLAAKESVRRGVAMLRGVQHRGQDAAGFLTLNHGFHRYRGLGLVSQVFNEDTIKTHKLEGSAGIGHTRYEIQGGDSVENTQPLIATFRDRLLGLAHNGNIPDLEYAKNKLSKKGIYPHPDFDSSMLVNLIVSADGDNWIEKIQNGLCGVEGSYSLALLTDDNHLIGVRDPWGNRPLSAARIDNGFVLASETKSFPIVKARDYYEIAPGEIIDFSKEGVRRSALLEEAPQASCIFEFIYLAHETSRLRGETVSAFRKRLGQMLAKKHPSDARVITAVPDASVVAANACAYESGKPIERLVLKNPDRGFKRSFMAGEMGDRVREVEVKFDISPDVDGLDIELDDDSVVIGNTLKVLGSNLRERGAKSLHARSTAPKIIRDCPWGTNMRSLDGEFIAIDPETGSVRDNNQIARELGLDSIDFNTVKELKVVADEGGHNPNTFCYYCFGGEGLSPAVLKSKRPEVEEFKFTD